jgi:predicted dithiol-disulfide oxidoreductase (DUF899 family)
MTSNNTLTVNEQITALEKEIRQQKEALVALRHLAPREPISGEYVFVAPDGSQTTLEELFGHHTEMVLIHHMGVSCNYCMLWADGFNGVVPHLQDRAAFVVVSPDKPETNAARAKDRHWQFPLYSHGGTPFSRELGFFEDDGEWPGVSTLVKDDQGQIFRVAKAHFGPGDDFAAIWHLFDLLPPGREWQPKQKY